MRGKIFLILSLLLSIFQIINAQNQEWIIYNRNNSPLPSNSIFAFSIDSKGNKWIGTLDSGLVRFDGKNWTIYNIQRYNFPSNTVYSILIDNLNNLWITTGNGLVKLNESAIEHTNFNLLVDFLCGAIDKLNNIWIGTGHPIFQIGAGIIKYNGITPIIFNKSNSSIPSDFIFSIAIDNENKKWIGTNNGLAIYDDSKWEIYNSSNSSLPSDFIFFIYIDSKNNKWIGTGYALIIGSKGGLVKYDGSKWFVYDVKSGLPTNFVTCAAEDKSGNLWFGTWSGGLIKFDGSKWIIYNTSNSQLPNNIVMTIFIDKYDNKWIGTYGGGLAVYRENGVIISVENDKTILPKNFELKQNYPNPFNSETTIEFSIPIQTHVGLKIFDLLGKEVATLIDSDLNAGIYKKVWNAFNLPSGIYFYKLQTNEYTEVKKLILQK